MIPLQELGTQKWATATAATAATHTSRLSLGEWTFGDNIENFESLLSIFLLINP